MDILENKVIPIYYTDKKLWIEMMKNSIQGVIPAFDSGRMAHEYYLKLYDFPKNINMCIN